MEVSFTPYATEVLSRNYHIEGEMRPRGNPNIFINDAQYQTLTLHYATLKPIMYGAKFGPVTTGQLSFPKSEIQIMAVHDLTIQDAQIALTKIKMIVFTDTYVIRGSFHTGPETKSVDVFYSIQGPFFPITNVEVYPIRSLNSEVGLKVELAYIHRNAVASFYEDAQE